MRLEILLIILGMTAVTFIPRFLPMAFMSRLKVPKRLSVFLEYVPVAVLAALVFPAVFAADEGGFGIDPTLLLSAGIVLLFSYKLRNLWGAVVLGMAVYWGLSSF
ncbi:MAG: AzlD domain-containing protein [Dehalogenimonas sp.]|uniref:AzlD domain-containing protein n=1 Tax=Candidatus Dehalogenimonas loeffleri TaxID=3127115 RepID=A0ABZ2J1Y7_9CHLR|nr:AzlD domain-containing protein [Dehalogenimonas sp.]